jgi:hypothetical protein
MVRPVITIALSALVAAQLGAQSRPLRTPKPPEIARPLVEAEEPPTLEVLEAITRRGRQLAEADEAAWRGSGAMTSLTLPADSVRRLIPRRTARGWEVAFGTLSSNESTFLISQLATPGIYADHWASSLFEPARPDTGYFARAGRALEASLGMFRPVARRPYIATAVPADDGPTWLVYVYPAPEQQGVWPRGGDMRFRVSTDGRVVIESRRLHETIMEYSPRTARSSSSRARYEQPAVTGNAPEDTDVFHVIQRRPAISELMTAGRFQYRIDTDGVIRLLGTVPVRPTTANDQTR